MAGKLSASLVVDLKDKTGAGATSVIGNLTRLQRAERDYLLHFRGLRLSERDRLMERVMSERNISLEERRRAMAASASAAANAAVLGTVAAGYVAGKAFTDYAALERRVNRIVLNADKGAEAVAPTLEMLQSVAKETQIGFDNTVTGLETLIASGQTLEEALAFLPSVALTAQASGAAIEDIGKTASALFGSMRVGKRDMQEAFDILVTSGKAGQFETNDMSQYLPSLLPAFAALGYEGTKGLQKLAAMLQTVRKQAGSSSEAATYLSNVLNKVYSADTANKFKKMGINLPRELDKARRKGEDVLDVFLDLAYQATKGDLAKLPLLFTDSEMQKGMRALLMLRGETDALANSLGNVKGTAMQDFARVTGDAQGAIERLETAWDKLKTKLGQNVSRAAVPLLDSVTNWFDDADAYGEGVRKTGADDPAAMADYRKAYKALFDKVYPGLGPEGYKASFNKDMAKVGRGEEHNFLDPLKRIIRNTELYGENGRARSSTVDKWGQPIGRTSMFVEFPGGGRNLDAWHLPERDVPTPVTRPGGGSLREERQRAMDRAMRQTRRFDSKGSYGKDPAAKMLEWESHFESDGSTSARPDQKSPFFSKPDDEDGVSLRPEQRSDAGTGGVQQVAFAGTPTVISQPSGVQQVVVTNPIRPNVTIHMPVTINEATNVDQVVAHLRNAVRGEIDAAHADTGYMAGA